MMDTSREIVRAELVEVAREHDATPARQTGKRVRLARRRHELEVELESLDRAIADRRRSA